jgi:hypothetical protein
LATSYTVIFAILTSGYLLLKYWNYSRYRIIRLNGQELFLAAGAIGTAVFFLGTVIHFILAPIIVFKHNLLIALEIFDNSLHGILLGFITSIVFVAIYNKWITSKADTIEKLINQDNDGLELMLLNSLKSKSFLSFTLTNRKVYIGVVISHFYSPYQNDSFQIFPFYSGYRTNDLSLKLNTDYSEVYNENIDSPEKLDQFSVTIKVSEIVSCSYFDREVYERFSMDSN